MFADRCGFRSTHMRLLLRIAFVSGNIIKIMNHFFARPDQFSQDPNTVNGCRGSNESCSFFHLSHIQYLEWDKREWIFCYILNGGQSKKKVEQNLARPKLIKNIYFSSFQLDMFELWNDNFKERKEKTHTVFLCASKANSIGRMELICFCLSTLSLFPYSQWLYSAAGTLNV